MPAVTLQEIDRRWREFARVIAPDAWSGALWSPLEGSGRQSERMAGQALRARLEAQAAGRPLRSSLSHTDGLAVALGLGGAGTSRGFRGVGVDLEPATRVVHPKLDGRIRVGGETALSCSALDLWVIKEACFKADPANPGRWLSLYEVEALGAAGRGRARGPGPEHFHFELLRARHAAEEWVVAWAIAVGPADTG